MPLPRRLSVAVLALLGLATLACGPHPDYPEACTCGSTLPPSPPPVSPLSLPPTPPLGTQCHVTPEHVATCAWEKAPPAGELTHVSADQSTLCALYTDGHLSCNVSVSDYANDPPFEDPGPWSAVSVSSHAACALRTDGTLWCKGVHGDTPAGHYVDVAVGYSHACALTAAGAVDCWGDKDWCQDDAPTGAYVDLSAAEQTTCGARTDGGIDCWGSTLAERPTHAGKPVEVIVTAGPHLCARYDDGGVACGDPSWRVPTSGRFVALSSNGFLTQNACALRDDGEVFCFGPSDTWPSNAHAVVMPKEPEPYNAEAWVERTEDSFTVKLPCDAPTETSPDGQMRRAACTRTEPAELIALEVIAPDPVIVAAGPAAMLTFAEQAKLLAFADARLTRHDAIELDGRSGVAFSIDLPNSVRMSGRAYVDGGHVYAITGMYDAAGGGDTSAYGRVTDAVASGRFAE